MTCRFDVGESAAPESDSTSPDENSNCQVSDTALLQTKTKRVRVTLPSKIHHTTPATALAGLPATSAHRPVASESVPWHWGQTWRSHIYSLSLVISCVVVAFVAVNCLRSGGIGVSADGDANGLNVHEDDVGSGDRDSLRCMELKIGGMTCSACSGTVERCLKNEKGVESAVVNLVLEKATVVFESSVTSESTLSEAVEDIGFESTILLSGSASELRDEGSATLHLEMNESSTEEFGTACKDMKHVVSSQKVTDQVVKLTYRPAAVGARDLLADIRKKLPGACIYPAPPQNNGHTTDLQKHADALWFNLKWSIGPAFVVFIITVVLPSLNVDLGSIDCRGFHIQTATVVVLVLATPVQFFFGADFHVQARRALARRAPNMDVLVSLATHISFAYALLVLAEKTCKYMGQAHMQHMSRPDHAMPSHGSHGSVLMIGLSCHALHFFGMAPILMAVVLCGKYIETKAKMQTMESLVQLMDCKSSTARLVTDESEEEVNVELVQVGDLLRLYDGCQVPVDGCLASDVPVWVNEAMLTGESKPAEKNKGSVLLGGSTVVTGSGLLKATMVGSKTALGEITTLISSAQGTKTRTQQLANTVASYFVTIVMACSVLVFGVWLHLAQKHLVNLPEDVDGTSTVEVLLFAAKFGVAVLMVACPCAMGLATPTAIMVATGVAAKMGCLVKSAEAFEAGQKVRLVVLDKTGTITQGTPGVSGVAISACVLMKIGHTEEGDSDTTMMDGSELSSDFGSDDFSVHSNDAPEKIDLCSADSGNRNKSGAGCPHCLDEGQKLFPTAMRQFWRLVGAVETGSDHPIAKCLTEYSQQQVCGPFPAAAGFHQKVGRGVGASVHGVDVRIGSFAFLAESMQDCGQNFSADPAVADVKHWTDAGRASTDSVVVAHVVIEGKVQILGAISVCDVVRPDARNTISHLKRRGIEVWMCSGDVAGTAHAIANIVGILPEHVCAEALPKHKADLVNELKSRLGGVCFVGDGVNDAPALAVADVGVAIGAGAHLAMNAADVVLVRSALAPLAAYLKLSRDTVTTIRRNYAWAFVFNFLGLPLAAGVFFPKIVLPPLVAGLAMGSSSALVVGSSLLLQFFRPPDVTS